MRSIGSSSIVAVLAIFAIVGCSKTTAQEKGPVTQSLPPVVRTPDVKVPAGDPCQLLTDAEVRQVFPAAKSGRRERDNLDFGFVACTWNLSGGYVRLQIFNREPDDSIEDDIELYTMGFVGSVNPEALRAVRLEPVNNVGERALAAVARADPPRVLQDGAVIVLQRGHRTIYINSPQLATRERAQALKALEALGRALRGACSRGPSGEFFDPMESGH